MTLFPTRVGFVFK